MIVLRDIPAIAELERLCWGKGAWLTEDEIAERADKVSLALFGVVHGDTFGPDSFSSGTEAQWQRAKARPDDWEDNFWILHPDISDIETIVWWMGLDDVEDDFPVDVTDEQDRVLRCLKFIARPLICVAQELLPEAVFTPDGSGGKAAAAEQWGAALEAEAAKFKARRR